MTWYSPLGGETGGLRAPPRPMAAHLLRWWRARFNTNLKHFSVLAEGERTDTEELVGRAPSQCSAPPDLLPSEARALLVPDNNAPTTPSPTLGHVTPACRVTAQTQPQPPSTQQNDGVHFEEFTCDVQVRGSKNSGGTQPLHFSFTLYDFDGHGRITKDDIAGIVSTIYESFGKNVTVPHYGSKTIQVRLTVSPDQRKDAEEEETQPQIGPNADKDHKVRFKRDLNNHVREGRRKPRRRQPESLPLTSVSQSPLFVKGPDSENAVAVSDPAEEERRSRLSIDDDVSDCSERLRMPKGFKRNIRHRQYQKNNLSPRFRNQQNNLSHHRNDIWNSQKENVLPGCISSPEQTTGQRDNTSVDGSRVKGSTDKKRSGSLQRRELLEIIQANMEKNHMSFQTSRKHYPDQRVVSSLEGDSVISKHRHRNRSNTFTAKYTPEPANQPSSLGENLNNGYLDLASTNINTHKESNICRYDSFLHAVICSSSQHAKTGIHIKGQQPSPGPVQQQKSWKSHHRSRSHDLAQGPFRYTLLEPYETITQETLTEQLKNTESRAKSFDYCKDQDVVHRFNINPDNKNKTHLNRSESKVKSYDLEQNIEAIRKTNVNRKPVVHGHACSPHHLKHQNREKYHARAMAQVEKWLENDNNTRLMKNSKKRWPEQDCKVSEKIDNLTANLDINDSLEWRGLLRGSEADGEGEDSNGTSTVHRYVHEHIHHHYHHFEDKMASTNAVVV